ncbi:MAG TPA: RagB/SusD family nutrient uptake outer membrane protein [Mucilaginibacter sp.]|nr:RagB/SusD family nutrient uptake outer membrane protein [Mucilaginibacter sp.]
MKTIFRKNSIIWACILGAFALSSCTKEFNAMNTDPSKVTQGQAQGDLQYLGGFFPDMEQNIASPVDYIYQIQQNLNADIFSGYMASPDYGFGPNNANYFMRFDWNAQAFDLGNQHIMNNWQQIEKKARPQDQHFVAIALILKVEAMDRITDIYGPIPYSKYGTSNFFVPYDSQQEIYTRFFKELDTAVNTLTTYVQTYPGAKPFQPFDLFYGGDYKQWLKFANTLRLRLAMRIVYVDAATAKAQAEKAVADPNGLLQAVGDDALLNMVNGLTYQNALWNITNAYQDISLNASMQSILEGYKDPREGAYFLKSAYNGKYEGLRSGLDITTPQYINFSLLNVSATTPMQIMSSAESWFLRAEGALRGWNMGGGTAQSYYEQGITESFQDKGVAMPAGYLTDATSTEQNYVDPTDATNNIAALNNITIAWNTGDSFEHNLQRIITQKWLAIYPDGQEAWSDFRRTGYPKIFPVKVNHSAGTITTAGFVKRLPFPSDETATNPQGVATGVTALGGPDNGGTRLWWDKNPNVPN